MRSVRCIVVLIIYCVLFNLYLFQLVNPHVPMKQVKLLYNYLNIGMLLFYFIDLKTGFESGWHEQFNNICFLVVILNYVLIIFSHHGLLTEPVTMFLCFNGAVIATSLFLLISGGRHDVFND